LKATSTRSGSHPWRIHERFRPLPPGLQIEAKHSDRKAPQSLSYLRRTYILCSPKDRSGRHFDVSKQGVLLAGLSTVPFFSQSCTTARLQIKQVSTLTAAHRQAQLSRSLLYLVYFYTSVPIFVFIFRVLVHCTHPCTRALSGLAYGAEQGPVKWLPFSHRQPS